MDIEVHERRHDTAGQLGPISEKASVLDGVSAASTSHDTHDLADMTQERPKDPLHGITLAMMLEQLVAHVGWAEMGRVIPIRCFTHDPSIKSSLTFLRKTPWARAKVESFYLDRLDEISLSSGQSEDRGNLD